jgi:hypothetical protein
MTQRAQVWQDIASRALAAVLTARTVPLRVEEDFHFQRRRGRDDYTLRRCDDKGMGAAIRAPAQEIE